MTWRAYLAHTMDGRKGQQLDISAGSASIQLNAIEDISVTASVSSLDGVERSWWSPWSGALIVSLEDDYGPERVIAAGPITRPLKQDRAAGTVTITARGIGALFEKREALAEDYGPGDEAALKRSVLSWSGVDLGTMVGRLITQATQKRLGWAPIVVPSERAGTRVRTYEGFNLANIGVWKLIQEITEVIGGPDVMLRPRWVSDDQDRVEWVLVTGTEAQPTIPQERVTVWDATAVDSPVASIDVVSSADALANRVYATGAGEGAGTAVVIAQTPELPDHMPLLEAVVSGSDTESTALLAERARAGLVSQPTEQLSLTVHNHQLAPFGIWHVGDAVDVECEGWLSIPDGTHRQRLIAAKFDLATETAQVECQDDVFGEEMTW